MSTRNTASLVLGCTPIATNKVVRMEAIGIFPYISPLLALVCKITLVYDVLKLVVFT